MTSTIREEIKKIIYFIVYLILEVSIFFIITKTLGGISIPNFRTAFLVIILLSLVNAILWPLLSYFSLRFIVVTLGFGTFLIDGILLYFISLLIPGVFISGIALFSVPLLIGLISSLVSLVLNIDDDDSYYHNILEKEMKAIYSEPKEKEGFIFLEIDGLSQGQAAAQDRGADTPVSEGGQHVEVVQLQPFPVGGEAVVGRHGPVSQDPGVFADPLLDLPPGPVQGHG